MRSRVTRGGISTAMVLFLSLAAFTAQTRAAGQSPGALHIMAPVKSSSGAASPTPPRHPSVATNAATSPLINHGGAVQTAPVVYVVYWGWGADPSGEQVYLNDFLSTLGSTSWLNTVKQYSGAGNPLNFFAASWSDPSTVPAQPTDAQIQAEALAAVSHFGLGTSVNTQIIVATPSGHSTPGFGTTFCAYHGALAARPNVTYTNLPYMTDAGGACGANSVSGPLDGVSIVEGHELAETITDPLLNAWFDSGGGEIGDKCAWTNLSTITTSAGAFAVQPLWSNSANGCSLATQPSDVLWYDPSSGTVSTWLQNSLGTILGKQDLDWTCTIASGCASAWRLVGTGDFNNDGHQDVTWYDAATGVVSTWLLDGSGHVLGTQNLDWTCSTTSGCAPAWQLAGIGDLNNDGHQDIVWYNATTGVVSIWLLDGLGNVLGTQNLDWTCTTASGCAPAWKLIGTGDFNNDGHQDIVWYNATSGVVSSWLLDGSGHVLTKQDLDWTCTTASGCAPAWKLVGTGDFNADGHEDIVWYNATTGVVSSWLLDGAGHVLGKQDRDWRCDTPSGCAQQWIPSGTFQVGP